MDTRTEGADVKPQRIQRKRTKGWRMPEGAVYVGRPTKWGNPYVIKHHGRCFFVVRDHWAAGTYAGSRMDEARAQAVADYKRAIAGAQDVWSIGAGLPKHADIRRELAGHDLACWCPLDQPCHADVLLEIANPGVSG